MNLLEKMVSPGPSPILRVKWKCFPHDELMPCLCATRGWRKVSRKSGPYNEPGLSKLLVPERIPAGLREFKHLQGIPTFLWRILSRSTVVLTGMPPANMVSRHHATGQLGQSSLPVQLPFISTYCFGFLKVVTTTSFLQFNPTLAGSFSRFTVLRPALRRPSSATPFPSSPSKLHSLSFPTSAHVFYLHNNSLQLSAFSGGLLIHLLCLVQSSEHNGWHRVKLWDQIWPHIILIHAALGPLVLSMLQMMIPHTGVMREALGERQLWYVPLDREAYHLNLMWPACHKRSSEATLRLCSVPHCIPSTSSSSKWP